MADRVAPPHDPDKRDFLKLSAGLTFGFVVGCNREAEVAGESATVGTAADAVSAEELVPNAWLNIAPSGTVTIMAPADEMGQGSLTSLPLILAEELDANWDDVAIELSPTDKATYGNPAFGGRMVTAAGVAVKGYYEPMRRFGAHARRVLLMNAAEKWQVPLDSLTTEPSIVVHAASGRRISYGDVAAFGKVPADVAEITPDDLKSPADFRLIGHDVQRHDVPAKIHGTAEYSIDAQAPDMVYAAVERAPIRGATVVSVDDADARQVAGVTDVLRRDDSVIVAADSYPSALAARRKLKVEWSRVGAVNDFDTDGALEEHKARVRALDERGDIWEEEGKVDEVFAGGGKVLTSEFQSDYVYHAQMEPLNATVWVKDGGQRVEAWVGTQAPTESVTAIAQVTGIARENIDLHRSLLGGGFGRRGVQEMDFVVDAAWSSKQLNRPVKVVWSREDDVVNGWFKPMTAQHLRAVLDDQGNVAAWNHRVAVQEPLTTAEPDIYEQLGRRPLISMIGTEQTVYNMPNRRAEHLPMEPGIRTYAMLAVGYTPNKFAVESFVDELAAEAGVDPYEFRIRLVKSSERSQKVLQVVADMANWGRPRKPGRALGIAFADYHGAMVAGAAEISLDHEHGNIKVHDFWTVIDPGVCVQPDNSRYQLEGAVIYALGSTLSERITFRNGVAQQSNFHDYTLMRMADTPRIHTAIAASDAKPVGVGQTAAVLVAPAIANAFATLTGKRLRHLPFTPDRVREVLAA